MALVPHRYTHFDSDLEDYMTDTDYYWVDCTQEDVAKFGPDAVASYIVNGKVSPEATKLFKHDAAGEITLGSIALSMCVAGGLAYSSVSSIEAGAPTIFAASLLSTIPGGFGGFFAGIARDTSKGYDPIIRMQARHQTHQLKKLIGTNHESVTSTYYEIYRYIDSRTKQQPLHIDSLAMKESELLLQFLTTLWIMTVILLSPTKKIKHPQRIEGYRILLRNHLKQDWERRLTFLLPQSTPNNDFVLKNK